MEKEFQLGYKKKERAIRPSSRILVVEATPDCIAGQGGDTSAGIRLKDIHRFISAMDAKTNSTILVDIVFPRPTNDENTPVKNKDAIRLRNLLMQVENINVVLGMVYINKTRFPELYSELLDDKEPAGIKAFTRPISIWSGPPSERVHPALIENVQINETYTGAILGRLDQRTKQQILYAPLTALLLADGYDPRDFIIDMESNVARIGDLEWVIDGNGAVDALYTNTREPFDRIRYSTALEWLDRGDVEYLRNRIVLFGEVDFGNDLVFTISEEEMHGVWFLAHMVNTLEHLKFNHTKAWPLRGYYLYSALVAVFLSASIFSGRKAIAVFFPIGLLLTILIVPWLSAIQNWYTIETVTPVASLFFSLVITTILCLLLGFNRDLRVEGQAISGTILFGDVIDSTPNLVAKGASDFQTEMKLLHDLSRSLVSDHFGTIERTLGDGFIATFSGNHQGVNHACRALACANALVDAIVDLNASGKTTLSMCFGFESGEFIGQFVREGGHRNWTSTGEPVVLAQRVQSACKANGALILAGPSASLLIGPEVSLENRSMLLKGFSDPVAIAVLRVID